MGEIKRAARRDPSGFLIASKQQAKEQANLLTKFCFCLRFLEMRFNVDKLRYIVRRIRDQAPRPILRRNSFQRLPQLRYHDRHRPRARCCLVRFLRHKMVKLVLHDSPGNADRTGVQVDIVPCHREQLRPAERVQREQYRKRGLRTDSGGD